MFLITENFSSFYSPKVGAIVQDFVPRLKQLIGLEFEYKKTLQQFLFGAIDNPLVAEYDSGTNTAESRESALQKFILCGPSMGFSAKQFAYGTLELIVDALVNNPDVPENPYQNSLNDQLVNITRYVGIAGEGDYNFMIAVYNISVTLSEILTNVIPVGPIISIIPFSVGGPTTPQFYVDEEDLDSNDAEDVVFIVSKTGPYTAPNYEPGKVKATIVDGKITEYTEIVDPGDGFGESALVEVSIDTTAPGQSNASQESPDQALVNELT